MRTTLVLILGTLLGISTASADTRTVTFENDFSNFFDLDRSLAPFKPLVEGLPITVKSGGYLLGWGGHSYTTNTPHERFPIEVVDNKLDVTIYDMPIHILFTILPKAEAMILEPLNAEAGYLRTGSHMFKCWLIKKYKEGIKTVNITLRTTIDPDEELVHCTEIVISFMDMAENDQLGFSFMPLKTLMLYNKNS